jgi:hypothetical protein
MKRASSLLALAETLLRQRGLREAVACFDVAEQWGADADRCAAGRWSASMLLGDFAAAWRESDGIRQRGRPDPNRFWNGEELRGKRVMVRCLHGFGDAVQFLRYVPRLRRTASRVIVEVAPQLVDLARCLDGVEEVITWGAAAPAEEPAWDVQIEVMELPYLFRTTLDQLPLASNYIALPEGETRRVRSILGAWSRPRVGIVWSSGEWDMSRSLPLQHLSEMLRRRDCEFWSLQGGTAREQWSSLQHCSMLRDSPEACDAGLLSLAAVVSELDLVITVDTVTAHLAGALGVPGWVMLQHASDWRWMVDRDDSPWYPSLRLFRQPRSGDWAGLVRTIGHALDEWRPADHSGRLVA